MRVLLIEDDSATAQSIELMLKSEGFNVYTTDLGEEGVDLGKLYDYDIILLDLNLPDMSGYEVLKTLRVAKIQTPILILSGLAGIENKVRGLGFGADDYMTKPFHKDELVARIHAVVRRSKGHSQSVIGTGKLKVNLDTKTVEVDNNRVHLTGKEYQMLELLSLRKGTTLTKEMFLNHLYGGMDEPELKIIDVFICKLRKKLAVATGGHHYIETVWAAAMCCAIRSPRRPPKTVLAGGNAGQARNGRPAGMRAAPKIFARAAATEIRRARIDGFFARPSPPSRTRHEFADWARRRQELHRRTGFRRWGTGSRRSREMRNLLLPLTILGGLGIAAAPATAQISIGGGGGGNVAGPIGTGAGLGGQGGIGPGAIGVGGAGNITSPVGSIGTTGTTSAGSSLSSLSAQQRSDMATSLGVGLNVPPHAGFIGRTVRGADGKALGTIESVDAGSSLDQVSTLAMKSGDKVVALKPSDLTTNATGDLVANSMTANDVASLPGRQHRRRRQSRRSDHRRGRRQAARQSHQCRRRPDDGRHSAGDGARGRRACRRPSTDRSSRATAPAI